jgi:hypothetical protein
MSEAAIGGYFELELTQSGQRLHLDAACFQSGRAAFLALLRAAKPERVWMPHYLCDSMYAPLRAAGVSVERYSLNERFEIDGEPDLCEGDWLYYVNYFGLCESQASAIMRRFGAGRVVLDNCQAFFSAPRACAATIYSPRKFFGVPDGGLLISTSAVAIPTTVDETSKQRSGYLIERLAESAEAGYTSYQHAEQSLEDLEPRQMSRLTSRMLASIDFERAKAIRNENFKALHEKLGGWNKFPIDMAQVDGPMCYPLFIDLPGLRERLIASRIFVATYWKDVRQTVEGGSWEENFVKNIVPLPCDQRYGEREMQRVVEVCADFIKNRMTNG